jgi:hypothetical protein
MAMEFTQPLTEMSSRNQVKRGRQVMLTTSLPSVSRLTTKCGNLDASQICHQHIAIADLLVLDVSSVTKLYSEVLLCLEVIKQQ